MNKFVKAVKVASTAHKFQMRKDGVTPFICHPIIVADLISSVGGVQNEDILAAAILHDIIEDTPTSYEEVKSMFGSTIANIIMECSDDKSLLKAERKLIQVAEARYKSYAAKIVKLADKIANMNDILNNPPTTWDKDRKLAYFDWSKEVVDAGLRGNNPNLESMFDDVYSMKKMIT